MILPGASGLCPVERMTGTERGPSPYTFLAPTLYLYSFLAMAFFLMKVVALLLIATDQPVPSSSSKTYSKIGEFPEAIPPTERLS